MKKLSYLFATILLASFTSCMTEEPVEHEETLTNVSDTTNTSDEEVTWVGDDGDTIIE